MTRPRLAVLTLAALVSAPLVGSALHRGWTLVQLGLAYKAKLLCSAVFVSGRPPEAVLAEDLAVEDLAPLRFLPTTIDRSRGIATARLPGLVERVARFRPGLGCTLLPPGQRPPSATKAGEPSLSPVSYDLSASADPRLDAALDWAMAEPDPGRPRRTRAALVLRDGRIVGERYAAGFHAGMPLAGWSLAKLATNALAGILVGQGRLDLAAPVRAPEWQAPGDPRGAITVGQLLRMESGLEFAEDHGKALQDVTFMLLREPDAAAFAARKPLVAEPGRRWSYASGNTNIFSRLMRQTLGEAEYPGFPRRALFGPLGMDSAVLETDASGTFVGSSFMYATARDWARLGQLFLDDGVHAGRRLLPEGWVRYSTTPAPAAPDGRYGAHVWLRPFDPPAAPLPPDAFHGVGFEGQYVSVVPSWRLVVVRLGLTRTDGAWRQDEFLRRVLAALDG